MMVMRMIAPKWVEYDALFLLFCLSLSPSSARGVDSALLRVVESICFVSDRLGRFFTIASRLASV